MIIICINYYGVSSHQGYTGDPNLQAVFLRLQLGIGMWLYKIKICS